MANFCMSCGAPVAPDAKFCILCGQTLEQEQPDIQHETAPEIRPMEYPVEQQQVQYQPLHPQQPYPQAVAKKKSKLPLILGIAGGAVVLIILTVVLLLRGASNALNNMAKANYYEIGSDEVSSIKLALGEQRTIAGISTSTRNGVTTKEITYSVDGVDQNEDMIAYMNYLREEDFLLLTDVDFSGPEGEGELGRNSIDAGYSILVQLEYDDTGYVITLIRQKGEIKSNDTSGSDSGQGVEFGTDPESGSDPSSDPSSEPGSDPGATPDPTPDPKPVMAAQSAIELFDGGCFHMIGTFEYEGQGSVEMETYRNGAKAALITKFNGTTTKTIIKDDKVYYIVSELKTVYIASTGVEEMMPEYGSAGMSYIGEGSGEFNGKTYPYSEYAEKDGGRSFYFMEGGTLKGIRVIIDDSSVFDVVIRTLDTNVPDDVFSWPADYKMEDS